jgi:L-fucose mutarotase/ribose pyranase (RbsD/FucU family)
MLNHMGLDENFASIRGQSTGNENGRCVEDPLLHGFRHIIDCDGMIVYDAIDAIIPIDQLDPISDSPDIITNMNFTRGLNPTEDTIHN